LQELDLPDAGEYLVFLDLQLFGPAVLVVVVFEDFGARLELFEFNGRSPS
jgi:hypothetical protein